MFLHVIQRLLLLPNAVIMQMRHASTFLAAMYNIMLLPAKLCSSHRCYAGIDLRFKKHQAVFSIVCSDRAVRVL